MTLWLVRHAKTAQALPQASDFDRELLPEGVEHATILGNMLARAGHRPDLILSSDARRAAQTSAILAGILGPASPVRFRPAIYHATPDLLRGLLADLEAEAVMVVGHNPGMEELASELAKRPIHLRPGMAAVLTYPPMEWVALYGPVAPLSLDILDPHR